MLASKVARRAIPQMLSNSCRPRIDVYYPKVRVHPRRQQQGLSSHRRPRRLAGAQPACLWAWNSRGTVCGCVRSKTWYRSIPGIVPRATRRRLPSPGIDWDNRPSFPANREPATSSSALTLALEDKPLWRATFLRTTWRRQRCTINSAQLPVAYRAPKVALPGLFCSPLHPKH